MMSSDSLLNALVRQCRAGDGVAVAIDNAADMYRPVCGTAKNEKDLMDRFIRLVRHLHHEAQLLPSNLTAPEAREIVISLLNRFYGTSRNDGFAEAYMQVVKNRLQSVEEMEDHLIQMLKEDTAARHVEQTIRGYLALCTWQDRIDLAEAVLREYPEGSHASIDISDAWRFAGCVEELLKAHIASVSELSQPVLNFTQAKRQPPETPP